MNRSNPIEIIQPQLFSSSVKAFFTKKNEFLGNSNALVLGLNLGFNTPDSTERVKQNRRILFDEYGIDIDKTVFCNQVHGTTIQEVSEPGLIPETDGVITSVDGLGLCILVADCAAVLIQDEEIGFIAALHAGWRGAVGGIVPQCLALFKQKGSSLTQVKAFISPCISTAKFEVGDEVAAQFPEKFVFRNGYEKPHVDLKGFILEQFIEWGVPNEQIEVNQGCTFSDYSQFYSYRREGKQSGRLMGFIQKNTN